MIKIVSILSIKIAFQRTIFIFISMKKYKDLSDVRLALCFKDFAVWLRTSCVGLNVAGFTTATFLKSKGIDVSVFPVRHNVDLVDAINKYNETHDKPLTHVVISAPWLSRYDVINLISHFRHI